MNDKPTVLATDLDGTLIPLGNDPLQRNDLRQLKNHFRTEADTLVFVTGRHLESTRQAILEHDLPQPDWIICDVGTSIYRCEDDGSLTLVREYYELLSSIMATSSMETLRERLAKHCELRLQEPEKQGAFKLSYYTDGSDVRAVSQRLAVELSDEPFEVISSLDPFNGDGLIDLLPQDASKAFALRWWSQATGNSKDRIVYAGDSGNDLAALTAGYLAIVVGNANPQVVDQARSAHLAAAWERHLYVAQASATSGVLEGCRYHGLIRCQ